MVAGEHSLNISAPHILWVGIDKAKAISAELKIHVFADTCIFSLTTSQSQKFIFKTDLK